ncbi:Hsp20/alpha crystallin family protein [Ascidiimonas aurantiaca]|uniref:Hsp20/alpha crystallin family protein n=1 Tax=Ascidiimonas aurantiaca TaxID=1685432 RepID=UPI0030EEDEF4
MSLLKKDNSFWIPSLFDEFFKPEINRNIQQWNRTNIPAVNIKESEEDFTIEVAAPGLQKEDFKIEIDQGVLTVSSEKEHTGEDVSDEGRFTRKEFSFTSFQRSFTLPETIQEDAIKAVYTNGVLHVTLPKAQKELPEPKKYIEVS